MTECLSALFLSVHFKSGASSITYFAVLFCLVLLIESFNSSEFITETRCCSVFKCAIKMDGVLR